MNEEMLFDRMCQIIRVGFVNARQPEKMRVKVTLPDTTGSPLITDWLPVLCPRACGDMQYDLPDVGDQVLCLFLPYGLEQDFVLGAMYGRQTPPVQSGDKWHRTFSDGAKLEYDRATHTLMAEVPGKINLKAGESITLDAPIIYERGTLQQTAQDGSPGIANFSGGMSISNGGLNVSGGDVVANGVSLCSHTTEGVQPGSGVSSQPSGGSPVSPGTMAKTIPEYGSLAYDAMVLTGLSDLWEKMEESPTPPTQIDDLIYCIPEICENMERISKLQRTKEGWHYLYEMFRRWLSGKANDDPAKGGPPFKVRWDWLKEFRRSKKIIEALSARKNLFTSNSEDLLKTRLYDNGYFGDDKTEFDFIHPPLKFGKYGIEREWLQWPKLYFQSRKVRRQFWFDFDEESSSADGEQVAMGSFMLYALAKGYTEHLHANKYKIVVNEVALLAYDSFNFEGMDFYFFWNCKDKRFSVNPLKMMEGYRTLVNSDFDSFRTKYGHGDSFFVISGPETIDFGIAHDYDVFL